MTHLFDYEGYMGLTKLVVDLIILTFGIDTKAVI